MTLLPNITRKPRARGFTIVELLVVVVIITVLIGAVLVASSSLLGSARSTGTRAMLQVVQEAVEEFRREQEAKPSIARGIVQRKNNAPPRRYRDRYGLYPPDELEVFADSGGLRFPQSLAPGRAQIVPEPPYSPMRYYPQATPQENAKEFRDQLAMQVAVQVFGQTSLAALERLPNKNRKPVPRDTGGDPLVFLDRGIPGTAPNGAFSATDLEVTYIVDDWGNPISYMSQRDWAGESGDNLDSFNHPDWNEASTELIRLNKGQPLIFSYGADGDEQMTAEYMGTDDGEPAAVSLVGDFEQATDGNHRIDDPLNADNVYIDPGLAAVLLEGIPE